MLPTAASRPKAARVSPSPGGDLSRSGNGERNSVGERRPAGPNERERVSPRRDEGERPSILSLDFGLLVAPACPPGFNDGGSLGVGRLAIVANFKGRIWFDLVGFTLIFPDSAVRKDRRRAGLKRLKSSHSTSSGLASRAPLPISTAGFRRLCQRTARKFSVPTPHQIGAFCPAHYSRNYKLCQQIISVFTLGF